MKPFRTDKGSKHRELPSHFSSRHFSPSEITSIYLKVHLTPNPSHLLFSRHKEVFAMNGRATTVNPVERLNVQQMAERMKSKLQFAALRVSIGWERFSFEQVKVLAEDVNLEDCDRGWFANTLDIVSVPQKLEIPATGTINLDTVFAHEATPPLSPNYGLLLDHLPPMMPISSVTNVPFQNHVTRATPGVPPLSRGSSFYDATYPPSPAGSTLCISPKDLENSDASQFNEFAEMQQSQFLSPHCTPVMVPWKKPISEIVDSFWQHEPLSVESDEFILAPTHSACDEMNDSGWITTKPPAIDQHHKPVFGGVLPEHPMMGQSPIRPQSSARKSRAKHRLDTEMISAVGLIKQEESPITPANIRGRTTDPHWQAYMNQANRNVYEIDAYVAPAAYGTHP
ncbi:hypothetical protein BJ742DRAFT_852028 [Cladochytrium replicatum]|nr:hypothetical protein BJ742DRAFT_852028 [Cladochytrium replicatum]